MDTLICVLKPLIFGYINIYTFWIVKQNNKSSTEMREHYHNISLHNVSNGFAMNSDFTGFAKDYSIAIANALGIQQSCTKPSI